MASVRSAWAGPVSQRSLEMCVCVLGLGSPFGRRLRGALGLSGDARNCCWGCSERLRPAGLLWATLPRDLGVSGRTGVRDVEGGAEASSCEAIRLQTSVAFSKEGD